MADEIDDDNDSSRGVTTPELHERLVRALLAEGVHTMIPASVHRYDADKQECDAQPLVHDFHRNREGALVAERMPLVTHAPVVMLTAGGFTFTVPIVAGTTGFLLFSERSLDRWLSGDGAQSVDPELYHRFGVSDAIFVPGLLSFGGPMAVAPPTDHATAGAISGPRIHFRTNLICIGDESGSKKLVLDGDSLTASAALKTWAAAVESGISSGGGTPPPTPFASVAGASGNLGTVAGSATQAKGH